MKIPIAGHAPNFFHGIYRSSIPSYSGTQAAFLLLDSAGRLRVASTIVNSLGVVIKLTRSRENLAGSAGTGSDGDSNRAFTLTTTNEVDIVEVYLDGVLLVETSQYSIDNNLKKVTFIGTAVFDSQILSVFYHV